MTSFVPNAGVGPSLPGRDCPLCPRLVAFRQENRTRHPDWWNGPVPSFGGLDGRLLIVGLAPGLQGANATGRPFTGDWAGDLLYATLLEYGFATGTYQERPDDGLTLTDCRIANAVRCVPPENKPIGEETKTCRRFLIDEIAALPKLKIILSLGKVSHDSVVAALGGKQSAFPFTHNAHHRMPGGLILADSYHCSRYNTNTGRLTEAMFHRVFEDIRRLLD